MNLTLNTEYTDPTVVQLEDFLLNARRIGAEGDTVVMVQTESLTVDLD